MQVFVFRRAESSLASLPDDVVAGEGRLVPATIRSHDQFTTTIYSNDDRYRGLEALRTVIFMNAEGHLHADRHRDP